MKNKDKYNLAHLHIVERAEETILGSNITYVEIKYDGKIVKEYAYTNAAGIKKFLEWLEEDNTNTLNEKEKAYLSVVINPFRHRVQYIKKMDKYCSYDKEFLYIAITDENLIFPLFEKGKMYKGMEANKRYTLEELGL